MVVAADDFDDDWQDMPVERLGGDAGDVTVDSDDDVSASPATRRAIRTDRAMRRRREHLRGRGTVAQGGTSNTIGEHLDVNDARGFEWRTRPDAAPMTGRQGGGQGYTQLRLDEDEDEYELQAATDYLFQEDMNRIDGDDDPTAAPISQLAMTKRLLSEAQKIAYVGLCSTLSHQMLQEIDSLHIKDKNAMQSANEWLLRVMIRLYQHLDIEPKGTPARSPAEQAMIESLSQHGILPSDLVPSLVTTHTIPNPSYDPQRARAEAAQAAARAEAESTDVTASNVDALSLTDSQAARTEAAETHESVVDEAPAHTGPPAAASAPPAPTATAPSSAASVSPPPAEPSDSALAMAEEQRAPAQSDEPTSAVPTSHDSTPAVVLTDPNSAAQVAEKQAAGEVVSAGHVTASSLEAAAHAPSTLSTHPPTLDGVTTEISESSKTITLDIRWTVLCDLFLVLTADSVYDARSRVLLERLADALGLTWMDVTTFEKRITDALEIEEDVQALQNDDVTRTRDQSSRHRRMVMMGLATLGGGLVIGLSAGLLAPVIGAGIGAALGAVGISGTTSFLGGVGGAAIITTTGTLSGATLGGRGMGRRVKSVTTFEFRPLHYHKRVNCIVTVPGFLKGPEDDPTLPYSVLDPIMGDAFSIMWEPEMMRDLGNAMQILWNETLVQGVQQVLAATVAGAMFSALAWPLWLTKLNYLIDNPWSNATERARAAGLILADVLMHRQLGVRPITLIGFSLGARMIFYALLELARNKAFGIVQNVYLMGAPVTANESEWKRARSAIAGRFVNGALADAAYSRTDWLLAYLHRATAGGVRNIAGLHPVPYDVRVENVDVTHVVPGHLAYRALTPLVLGELGFKTTADYFDEPESLANVPEREVVREEPAPAPTTPSRLSSLSFSQLFGRKDKTLPATPGPTALAPEPDDLPTRLSTPTSSLAPSRSASPTKLFRTAPPAKQEVATTPGNPAVPQGTTMLAPPAPALDASATQGHASHASYDVQRAAPDCAPSRDEAPDATPPAPPSSAPALGSGDAAPASDTTRAPKTWTSLATDNPWGAT